jgi:hypothetical protein
MRSEVLIALALFGDNRAIAADSDVDEPAPLQPCRPSLGPVAMSVSRADTSGLTRNSATGSAFSRHFKGRHAGRLYQLQLAGGLGRVQRGRRHQCDVEQWTFRSPPVSQLGSEPKWTADKIAGRCQLSG